MPRIRSIKPEFPQSESMGNVSREARLCFILLWTQADDEGRLRGSSRMLASLLYPYDDDARGLMDGWLAELDREDCLRRYRIDDHDYIQILNWLKHQKIDHANSSKLPPFCEDSRTFANIREDSRGSREDSPPDQGGDQGGDQGVSKETKNVSFSPRRKRKAPGDTSAAGMIYKLYPRKEGRTAGISEIDKALARLVKGEAELLPMSRQDAQAFLSGKVEAYAHSPAGSRADREMIPYPQKWFKQSRYLDDESNWQIAGGPNGRYESTGAFNQREYEKFAKDCSGVDEPGDSPWEQDGQDGSEPVLEASGRGKS